jgi:hypothetical protein
MVRSAPGTNIQLGFVRHAELVMVAEKLSARLSTCDRDMNAARSAGTSAAKLLGLPRVLIFQPEVQYYMNCGGCSQTAVVLGFHTRIDF